MEINRRDEVGHGAIVARRAFDPLDLSVERLALGDYSGRTYAEGKKINWKDGVRAIWCILKYR